MISKEQNERLTRIGPGTPCGELLRRYWQPVCPALELSDGKPTKRVRVMGEELVVFRDPLGNYACVEEFCAHRGASLANGFVEEGGIRCCYHGWKYDGRGKCLEQPFELEKDRFLEKASIKSYPVEILGGLVFIYMGPDPDQAPLLPRWDVLVREDGARKIDMFPVHHCNWLQIQENTADSTHTLYLHAKMFEYHKIDHPYGAYYNRPITNMTWEYCEWGIEKTISYGGDVPDIEIRPPLLFPNMLRIPNGPKEMLHWRVPIDDENTQIVFIAFSPEKTFGETMKAGDDVPFDYMAELKDENGNWDMNSFFAQDQMAMESQGAIYNRENERLGASDRGIAMFRNQLDEQITRVENGEAPSVGVVADADKNQMITFDEATSPVEGIAKMKSAAHE